MTEGTNGLGDWEQNPETSTSNFDKLCNEAIELDTLIRGQDAILEEKRQALRQLHYKIEQTLDFLQKDKHVSSLGVVEIRSKLSFKVPRTDEDKFKLFSWLQSKGMETFYRYCSVNSQALQGLGKAEYEAAKETGKEFSIPGVEAPLEYRQLYIRRQK